MIATTIAWDNTLLWTWEKAMDGLQDTIHQVYMLSFYLSQEKKLCRLISNQLSVLSFFFL